jgi:hypothetical protein
MMMEGKKEKKNRGRKEKPTHFFMYYSISCNLEPAEEKSSDNKIFSQVNNVQNTSVLHTAVHNYTNKKCLASNRKERK